MKKLLLCFLVSVSLIACTNQETKKDMVKIKAEIEALEGKWNSYNNARDINGLLELYADDAVQLPNNQPMLIGKAAIQKNDEVSFINRAKGQMEIGQTVDVIGDENLVTEIGKATQTDSTGKVISIGKYMIVWKKINGKYLIIREMWNDDVKPNQIGLNLSLENITETSSNRGLFFFKKPHAEATKDPRFRVSP